MDKSYAEDSYDYPEQMQKTIIVEQPDIIINIPDNGIWVESISAVVVALIGMAAIYWQRHKKH